jgi:hypothetical protein
VTNLVTKDERQETKMMKGLNGNHMIMVAKPTMIDDEQLVAGWHERETCPAIARRLGVNQEWLTLQWRRLRQQGKLPKDRRRNASLSRADDDAVNDRLDGRDGRPDLKTRDRLLRRLIAVHGEPRFDLFNFGRGR